MVDLLGETPDSPRKQKAAKKKAETDGAVVRLFAVYKEEFRRKWNSFHQDGSLIEPEVKPLIHYGRDGKFLKSLKEAWNEEEVAQLIRDFFASTDPQAVRSDYSVQAIFVNAQKIRINATRQGRVQRDARTAENIDAAKRAMGPKR